MSTKFGFCLPIFANPGMLFFRTPAYKKLDWTSIKETVLYCEKLGYDSLFVADHLFLGNKGEIWECTSTMSALASITSKMEIIPIHLCNNYRHPGLVAKTLATMSHISDGRITLFYDYGWRQAEFETYGIEFCSSDAERIEQMEEGIQIIKGLLEKDRFSFNGTYYTLKDAICTPKPVKKIPLWMGEANHSKMIESIVKYADGFNSMPCSPDAFIGKLSKIHEECDKQGRDFSELELSLETQVLLCESDQEVDEKLDEFSYLMGHNDSCDLDILKQLENTTPEGTDFSNRNNMKEEFLIGTPKSIKEKINFFTANGVSHFMLWFMDYPEKDSIRLFAKNFIK